MDKVGENSRLNSSMSLATDLAFEIFLLDTEAHQRPQGVEPLQVHRTGNT